jgi:hypothetical protein
VVHCGKPLSEYAEGRNAFQLDISVTDETNTKAEKAQYLAAIFGALSEVIGDVNPLSYIHVIDARAAADTAASRRNSATNTVDSRISVSSVVRAAGLYSVPMFTSVKGCKPSSSALHRSHCMKQVTLPGGERVPALGMGTWNIGDHRRHAPRKSPRCNWVWILGCG